jgi:pyridoxal 5'-phosphate synthase pdxS subunit
MPNAAGDFVDEPLSALSRERDMDKNKDLMTVKIGLAEMLRNGVIMDVTNAEQAKIAEEAGAVAVMALERVPSDIRAAGGVARMADPAVIEKIKSTVTIPVMAKCRIGHFAEAQMLQAMEVDFIDESEVLTPADYENHVDKFPFKVPFVCGCRNLSEALRRIAEGAAMIRTKGEAGTGDVSEAVRHLRLINKQIKELTVLSKDELSSKAKELAAPLDLVKKVAELARLPVPNFAAGGIATPADASLCMQLGAESVFVGSGIFKSEIPERMAKAIVAAVARYDKPGELVEISRGLGASMKGISVAGIDEGELLHTR